MKWKLFLAECNLQRLIGTLKNKVFFFHSPVDEGCVEGQEISFSKFMHLI